MSVFVPVCQRSGALVEDCGGTFACDNGCDAELTEFGALDDLAREFHCGRTIGVRAGKRKVRVMTVVGVCWSLPLVPGGPDEAAVVARDRLGNVGHVYGSEIVWVDDPRIQMT